MSTASIGKGTSMKTILATAAVALLALAAPARADVWDLQTDNDNTSLTDNELVHGIYQMHDLAAQTGVSDEDWYVIETRPYSSYEVIVGSTSGDLNLSNDVARLDSSGTSVLQFGEDIGFSYLTRWQNTTGTAQRNYIRVGPGQSCTVGCGPDDVYDIRMRETTFSIPRFNNAGGQVTVLIVQNPTHYTNFPFPPTLRPIAVTAWFWSPTGTLLGSQNFSLAAKASFVINTSTIPGVAGQSGTITVSHDGGYGDLTGKTVALDPATGFSFDTPMIPRVN